MTYIIGLRDNGDHYYKILSAVHNVVFQDKLRERQERERE